MPDSYDTDVFTWFTYMYISVVLQEETTTNWLITFLYMSHGSVQQAVFLPHQLVLVCKLPTTQSSQFWYHDVQLWSPTSVTNTDITAGIIRLHFRCFDVTLTSNWTWYTYQGNRHMVRSRNYQNCTDRHIHNRRLMSDELAQSTCCSHDDEKYFT